MSTLEHLAEKALAAANGELEVLSTGEQLAAALILNRHDWLVERGYTIAEALERVGPAWATLIPAAAQIVARTTLALEHATRGFSAAQSLKPLADDYGTEVNAHLVTWSESGGYRHVTIYVDIEHPLEQRKIRLGLRFSATDTANMAQYLISVHRLAWEYGGPLDRKPGEEPPYWIK
jgi:hypothetical protein